MANLFRRILVPHDFSVQARKALRIAADLAAAHHGRLIVLHVITPAYPPAGMVFWVPDAELAADARISLERETKAVLGRRPVKVAHRVVIGVPFQQILTAARDADSIVMATMGRSGLVHALLGSVAEKVVRHAPIPVLTVRAGRAGRRARRAK
jgi:nucleotide-binding universal stress UspA family protein